MKIRAVLTVTGLVQGVNFRYHTQVSARRLNVTGWVRNLPGGDVEVCVEGDEAEVAELLAWCRQGPASARVDGVRVLRQEYRGEFGDFLIQR
jgi:acylphosphatase